MAKLETKDLEIAKLRTLPQNPQKVTDLKKNNQPGAENPAETEDQHKMDTVKNIKALSVSEARTSHPPQRKDKEEVLLL